MREHAPPVAEVPNIAPSGTAPSTFNDVSPSNVWVDHPPDFKGVSVAYASATRSSMARLDDNTTPTASFAHTLSLAPDPAVLDEIVQRLTSAGVERVRAGMVGDDLIVEYENHRYNKNEADALGIIRRGNGRGAGERRTSAGGDAHRYSTGLSTGQYGGRSLMWIWPSRQSRYSRTIAARWVPSLVGPGIAQIQRFKFLFRPRP